MAPAFQGLTPYFAFLLFTATLGPFLFGYHLGELNAPEDVIRCKVDRIESQSISLPQCMPMNPLQWGLVSSIYTFGGLVGALSIAPVSAKKGRIRSMQVTSAFQVAGPLLEAAAPSIAVIALGRFVAGVGVGAALVVVPIYVSEVSPPGRRGFFGAFTQIMTNTGILVAQLFGYFFSRGQLWRVILAAAGGFAALQAAGLLFAAESPKWLANQGHMTLARTNLRKIRGKSVDTSEETTTWAAGDGEGEAEGLLGGGPEASQEGDKKKNLGIMEVIRHPDHGKAVVAIMVIMAAQQLTGINSVVMYGVHLLSSTLGGNSAKLNLILSLVNLLVTVSAAPLVDRLGRKVCLLASITGMGVSSLFLGASLLASVPGLSAAAVLAFVGSFGLGLGAVPWLLASELVDTEAVAATQGLALVSSWVSTFLVAQFFPLANDVLHGRVYFVFAALAALFGAFIAWRVPESSGKANADEVWGRVRRED